MIARLFALSAIAASSIAAASAIPAPKFSASADLPSSKWWEKVTVTVASEDQQPTCTFSSSHEAAKACSIDAGPGALAGAGPEKGQMTKIVFERRFEPGATEPRAAELAAGEMLLGGQVLKLAIDAAGKVEQCKVVATAGDLKPEYGCTEAARERFTAGASAPAPSGFMTVLIYAHSEQVA